MSKMRPKPLPRRTADLVSSFLENGGASRDRTDDLLNAIQALSQLSYDPIDTALRLSLLGSGDQLALESTRHVGPF